MKRYTAGQQTGDREGGLKRPEIGRIFGLDYGCVSQERKRLREKLRKDRRLWALMSHLEGRLSTSETCALMALLYRWDESRLP